MEEKYKNNYCFLHVSILFCIFCREQLTKLNILWTDPSFLILLLCHFNGEAVANEMASIVFFCSLYIFITKTFLYCNTKSLRFFLTGSVMIWTLYIYSYIHNYNFRPFHNFLAALSIYTKIKVGKFELIFSGVRVCLQCREVWSQIFNCSFNQWTNKPFRTRFAP